MSDFMTPFFNSFSKFPGLKLAAPLAPQAAIEQAQTGLANFSRAFGHVTRGMMAASVAQMELARSLYSVSPEEWQDLTKPGASRDAMRHWLHHNETKFENAIKSCRRINDELLASFFEAADSLTDAAAQGASTAADSAACAAAESQGEAPKAEAAKTGTAKSSVTLMKHSA